MMPQSRCMQDFIIGFKKYMPMFEENLLESSIIIVMTSILAYVGCKSESMNKKQLKEKDNQ
jgi:hypothetical protein